MKDLVNSNYLNNLKNKIMTENELTYKIRGAIFDVYYELGPGLLESIYHESLIIDLKQKGLKVSSEISFPLEYKGETLKTHFRLDLLVEDKIIIEIKSVKELTDLHHKQLLTYLKITKLSLGILVNFNSENIQKNIFRKVNNYLSFD
jgi:GxxExxY protein